MNLKSWMRRSPQAVAVRAVGEDGKETVIRIHPAARRKWQDAETALLAVNAVRYEALNEKSEVLRTWADEEDEEEPGEILPPQKSEYIELAGILNDTADRAAQRHENAYKTAFEQLTQITNFLALQFAQLAKAYLRLAGDNAAPGPVPFSGDPDEAMKSLAMEFMKSKFANGLLKKEAGEMVNGGK